MWGSLVGRCWVGVPGGGLPDGSCRGFVADAGAWVAVAHGPYIPVEMVVSTDGDVTVNAGSGADPDEVYFAMQFFLITPLPAP